MTVEMVEYKAEKTTGRNGEGKKSGVSASLISPDQMADQMFHVSHYPY